MAGVEHASKGRGKTLADAHGLSTHKLGLLSGSHVQQFGQRSHTKAASSISRGDQTETRALSRREAPTVVHGVQSPGKVNGFQPFRIQPGVRTTNQAQVSFAATQLAYGVRKSEQPPSVPVHDRFYGGLTSMEADSNGKAVQNPLAYRGSGQVLSRESEVDTHAAAQSGKLRGYRVERFLRGVDRERNDTIFERQSFVHPFTAGHDHRLAVFV